MLLICVNEYNIGLAHFFFQFFVLYYRAAKGKAVMPGPSGLQFVVHCVSGFVWDGSQSG